MQAIGVFIYTPYPCRNPSVPAIDELNSTLNSCLLILKFLTRPKFNLFPKFHPNEKLATVPAMKLLYTELPLMPLQQNSSAILSTRHKLLCAITSTIHYHYPLPLSTAPIPNVIHGHEWNIRPILESFHDHYMAFTPFSNCRAIFRCPKHCRIFKFPPWCAKCAKKLPVGAACGGDSFTVLHKETMA